MNDRYVSALRDKLVQLDVAGAALSVCHVICELLGIRTDGGDLSTVLWL